MAEDFGSLLISLGRAFPEARLELLPEEGLAAICAQYREVPDHYLSFLREVGWGSLGGSLMLYSGLCEPNEIFDAGTAADLHGLVFFGDNFSGDMFGFDTRNGWQLISLGSDYLQPQVEQVRTIGEFLARWIAAWKS